MHVRHRFIEKQRVCVRCGCSEKASKAFGWGVCSGKPIPATEGHAHKFWMVVSLQNNGGISPPRRHSLGHAKEEARHLASQYPGSQYVVLEAVVGFQNDPLPTLKTIEYHP